MAPLMRFAYFIKFSANHNVDRFVFESFEEMWHDIREFMLRNNTGHIEWMIRE